MTTNTYIDKMKNNFRRERDSNNTDKIGIRALVGIY